jgi:hypothetical protein
MREQQPLPEIQAAAARNGGKAGRRSGRRFICAVIAHIATAVKKKA